MEEEKRELSVEVLNSIIPFSGVAERSEGILQRGTAVQKVQTSYVTAVAVQKPRVFSEFTANILAEAKLAGSSFYYRWKVKDKKTQRESIVEGASIDLAMCCARNYGNCVIDVEEEETLSDYKFKGTFIDLESGFTCPRLFKQRKKQNVGLDDLGRTEDIVYQVGQSKAIRNAIVRAMPSWLLEQAIETATQAEITRIKPENIAIARARSFDFFRQYGITKERMEGKVGRKLDEWTPSDIVDLRGMATALKEGRITAQELFPEMQTEKSDETIEVTKRRQKNPKPTPPEPEQPEPTPVVESRSEQEVSAPAPCPNQPETTYTKKYCDDCPERPGCPVWEVVAVS